MVKSKSRGRTVARAGKAPRERPRGGRGKKKRTPIYRDPTATVGARIADARRRIALRSESDADADARHTLLQFLARLVLLSDRRCGSHTDEAACASDETAGYWLPPPPKRGWWPRWAATAPKGTCVGRAFHRLGLRTNPPSADDVVRIGKRHEALRAAAAKRPLLPEETEQLYVLDALQAEFEHLGATMERESAALRTIDDEIRHLLAELAECRRDSVRCPAAERTRLTARLEKLWDDRRKQTLSWTDVLKSLSIPVVTTLLRVAVIAATTGGIAATADGVSAALGGATGLVGAVASATESTTKLVDTSEQWRPLATTLCAAGVFAASAACGIAAGPAALLGAGFVGATWLIGGGGAAATAPAVLNASTPRSCCWPTGDRVPLHPTPLPVYATRIVDDTVCFFDKADLRRHYPAVLRPDGSVDYVRLLVQL